MLDSGLRRNDGFGWFPKFFNTLLMYINRAISEDLSARAPPHDNKAKRLALILIYSAIPAKGPRAGIQANYIIFWIPASAEMTKPELIRLYLTGRLG
jgi:hypothetical protein